MNRDLTYGGVTTNQITALANAGYLNSDPGDPHAFLALAKPDESAVSQEFRVRSYLAANCSQCHRPGGLAVANFDTRISTPTDNANLINGALSDNLGDPANRTLVPNSPEHSVILQRMSIRGPKQMPPLASNVPDTEGADLVRAFITGELANRQSFAQWQAAHFSQPLPPEAAPTADPDSDGASNMLEFMTGSNPTQSGDAWGIQLATDQNGLNISFKNPANRAVIIETATSIPPIWTPVDDANNQPTFPAVAGARTISDSLGSETMRLYRARIIAP
jgi:mono/diheme cytochrome c family protein